MTKLNPQPASKSLKRQLGSGHRDQATTVHHGSRKAANHNLLFSTTHGYMYRNPYLDIDVDPVRFRLFLALHPATLVITSYAYTS